MIQRIQSIYLLVAAILMAVTVFSPLAFLADGANGYYIYRCLGFFQNGVGLSYPTWGVVALVGLTAVISIVSLFLYKNRKLQIKMSYISLVLILASYGTIYTYLETGSAATASTLVSVKYGAILPIVAFIFTILAIIKIKADEKLVQSLNRIR